MSINISNQYNDTVEITLSDDLSIASISEIKECISEALQRCTTLVLRNEEVQQCDITYIQMLISLQKTCKAQNKTLEVYADTERYVSKTFRSCGFTKEHMNLFNLSTPGVENA